MTAHLVGTWAERFSPSRTDQFISSRRRSTSTITATWAAKTMVRLSKIISSCRLGVGYAHALLVVGVAISGCSSDTLPVHGTVQREGAAMNEGRIVFTPIGGGRSAFGEIQ